MNKVFVFLTFRKIGGNCPFCGRPLTKGQNGWYCTCSEWNSAQREAYEWGLID